ncbi:MAG TPA: TlpA disulfide reductase family protein [Acidimicrobiia bacterium]|nr:TlpA disulfide reductase family protein [Acidimicrobiia bacterium]
MLDIGATAPSFALPDVTSAAEVTDPWRGADAPTVLAFFKTTCPVCKMAAPKIQALADAGVRVVAVGEDPPDALARYAAEQHQHVTTLAEDRPYRVSDAYALTVVPTLFAIDPDGRIVDAVESWDRDRWNEFATRLGAPPVSDPSDGLPSFRPG